MPNINDVVVYTASGIVTTNPPGAAVNHTWSLPLGGGTVQSGVPTANQATVTWGNTAGTFSVRDTAEPQTNSCGPVQFELENISVTNNAGSPTLAVTPNCNAFNGTTTFDLTISGGTAPYTAVINGGGSQNVIGNTITLTGVSGNNSITITDNLGNIVTNSPNYSCERYHVVEFCAGQTQAFIPYSGLTVNSVYQLDCNQCVTVLGSPYTNTPTPFDNSTSAALKANCIDCLVFDYVISGSCSGVNQATVSGTIVGQSIGADSYDYSYESDVQSPASAFQSLTTNGCGNFTLTNLNVNNSVLILNVRENTSGTIIARTVTLNC